MRTREEIENQQNNTERIYSLHNQPVFVQRVILELLLDIREQLIEANKKEITGVIEDKSNN